MFKNRGIRDERITAIKHKITNEAYGIMYIALMLSVFVKTIILKLPLEQYITEVVIFFGTAIYVVIRMITSGIYCAGMQNSHRKIIEKTTIVSVVVFMVTLAITQYFLNQFDIFMILVAGTFFVLATIGFRWVTDKFTEKKEKELLKDDEE